MFYEYVWRVMMAGAFFVVALSPLNLYVTNRNQEAFPVKVLTSMLWLRGDSADSSPVDEAIMGRRMFGFGRGRFRTPRFHYSVQTLDGKSTFTLYPTRHWLTQDQEIKVKEIPADSLAHPLRLTGIPGNSRFVM